MYNHSIENFCVCMKMLHVYAMLRAFARFQKFAFACNPFVHAMSDSEASVSSPLSSSGEVGEALNLTIIEFKDPKALEGLPAGQSSDLRSLDKFLDSTVKKLKAQGAEGTKQKSRYILSAKKYLIKYHPQISISDAADHPVMFGIILLLFAFSPIYYIDRVLEMHGPKLRLYARRSMRKKIPL